MVHAFILLLDFAEYKELDKNNLEICILSEGYELENIFRLIYTIIKNLVEIPGRENYYVELTITEYISIIINLCKQQNIDIEKHVMARLEYMRGEE